MYKKLSIYHLIYSLPQRECDELLQAAKVGNIDVISTMINDGVDMNAIVNKVDTHVYIYVQTIFNMHTSNFRLYV